MNTKIFAVGQRVQIAEQTYDLLSPDATPQTAIAEGIITGINSEDGTYQVSIDTVLAGGIWFSIGESVDASRDNLAPLVDTTNLLTAIATLQAMPPAPARDTAIASLKLAIAA